MCLPCIINNGFCLFKVFQASWALSFGLTVDTILDSKSNGGINSLIVFMEFALQQFVYYCVF